ncbi:nif-specific transcriptional activator NifA [Marichromatium bheemlicum]|uniref:Nif-specific regulatory protein n=1 Tax=Marichromatium bheemlicum TaxID=365339 RepID=A0ABX1I5W1_9GAMM|nr:nif-specific transcriptional activator NifA [Marichromatium bheemlicum]NKN32960.1 nif-specific transcriptional activator NifA [Marichromatium bheemlicum]
MRSPIPGVSAPREDARRLALLESQLGVLFEVSSVLSRSLDLRQTLSAVLSVLDAQGRLRHGMVSLLDDERGELLIGALHDSAAAPFETVSYRPGEGVIGQILASNAPWILPRTGDEPRFLDRLNLYDPELPFIGVPIRLGEAGAVGVLAAQPLEGDALLEQRAHFLEMVANLIGQAVRLARRVEAEQRALREERDTLRREVRGAHGFDSIIGRAAAMRLVFEQVRQVAKWNTTVLIRGESGTGKELIANAIHYNSPRARGAFVRLNCAALPDNLLESELFGHEKGAFTGAASQRKGRFEQADGGTLFLDEIGEISPAFQAKLLRVLQEGEFERVGGTRTLKVDVRVITATNRDLEGDVRDGGFREDLYYRLNVMPIRMPPLRERLEDVPELARFLVDKIARVQGRTLSISDSALRVLMCHDWPGNVRELENCLERAAVMSVDGRIDREVIDATGLDVSAMANEPPRPVSRPGAPRIDFNDPKLDERERVIAALEEAGWVQAKAARLLNMTPRQIAYRIQTLNIKVRQF